MIHRVASLDYLRGLSAFGIMMYHYSSFSFGSWQSDSLLGRIGIYGVSIFYILSGLTLFLVYRNNFNLYDFYIKRLFRIFPLLWLVMAISILIAKQPPSAYLLFINFTGLFSFLDWSKYIGTGVWSIGNELCFYLAFPLLLITLKKTRYFFWVVTVFAFVVYCLFAFVFIDETSTIQNEWQLYINPLNQVALFVIGILIGFFSEEIKISVTSCLTLLTISILIFFFYPAQGDRVQLITGSNRLVFTLLSAFICLSFFKMEIKVSLVADYVLKKLGESSYSLYLIHPLVWHFVNLGISRIGLSLPSYGKIVLCSVTSLILSYMMFEYFEKYFINMGKKIVSIVKITTFKS
jgi:exopolysaccharide production protein ExoZ